MLQQLLATDPRATGHINISCNGCSVLDHLQSKNPVDLFAAHSNLLNACKNMEKILPCTVMYLHIKGYQDNGHPTVLSWLARLNKEANLLAKACIDGLQRGQPEYQLPNESWFMEITG